MGPSNQLEWPARDQVIAALTEARRADDISAGWRGLITRLAHEAEHLTGLALVRDRLARDHDELAGDRGPTVSLAIHQARSAVSSLWRAAIYRYTHRAQAALDALAADSTPGRYFDLLPGERAGIPTYTDEVPEQPSPDLPESLASLQLPLIRSALQQLDNATLAGVELEELTRWENEETGEVTYTVPEHMIDEANELEAEAARWDEYLADYADAVAYTLVTALRDRLRIPVVTP